MGGTEQADPIWNVEMEVNLFHAMRGHKPAGVNRHFQMISIHDRLSNANKKITSDDVWAHLARLYDLQALNESEIVPFPNKSGDFELSDDELTDLCIKNFPRTPFNTQTESAPPKSSSKTGKQDSKSSSQTPKNEKSSSHGSKSESKSSSSSSNRSDHKSHSSSNSKSSAHHLSSSNTPDPSPKRGKRTRNVPSNTNSPITPSEPPVKRRR